MRQLTAPSFVLAGFLALACGGGGGGSAQAPAPPAGGSSAVNQDPGGGPSNFTSLTTHQARGLAVASGIVARGVSDAHGLAWQYTDGVTVSRTGGIYDGSGGILVFLAEAYRQQPSPGLRNALESGGQWLLAQPVEPGGAGLYSGGESGRGWAFLSLYEALGEASWLQAAEAKGQAVIASGNPAAATAPADLIYGPTGDGLFFLRLHKATGNATWLQAAKAIGDAMIVAGTTDATGLCWPELANGEQRDYPGLAHGAAGGGFFLCRLAGALGTTAGAPYKAAALQAAQRLRFVEATSGGHAEWCFYLPGQATIYPVQWCHGSPGVGIFFTELYGLTGDAADLQTAVDCANADAALSASWVTSACLCHGAAGNGELFLKLYRATGDPAWLQKAQAFGDAVWSSVHGVAAPVWISGDGSGRCNENLMTGNAGAGHFLLELGDPAHLAMPITN